MKAKEFDKKFNDNENIVSHLDISQMYRPGYRQRRVNVDFPAWVIDGLDIQAARLGVTRQSVIKTWIAERLEQITANH